MGAGILMSRAQANAAMQAARARNSRCNPCPPSPPNGGVTGSQPATGQSPSGQAPTPRQDMLQPRPPAGRVAKATGNNPCGGNRNASQNVNQNGYTNNPNVLPISTNALDARPVNPYQDNPLELPTNQPGGRPATNGNGDPTQYAQSGCASCSDPTSGGADTSYYGTNPDSAAADTIDQQSYQRGYYDGVAAFNAGEQCCPDDRSVSYPPGVVPEQYFQGYTDGLREGGTSEVPSPGYGFTYNPRSAPVGRRLDRRRPLRLYNPGNVNNVRRGVRRFL